MITDSISSKKNTIKEILFFQSLSQVIYGISSIILGGYSAAVQNAVTIIRNYFASKEKTYPSIEVVLIILGVVLGYAFNNLRYIGFLPIIANFQYSVVVFKFKKNEKMIKISFAICIFIYVIFNFLILNIVGGFTNFFVFCVTVHELLKRTN